MAWSNESERRKQATENKRGRRMVGTSLPSGGLRWGETVHSPSKRGQITLRPGKVPGSRPPCQGTLTGVLLAYARKGRAWECLGRNGQAFSTSRRPPLGVTSLPPPP